MIFNKGRDSLDLLVFIYMLILFPSFRVFDMAIMYTYIGAICE